MANEIVAGTAESLQDVIPAPQQDLPHGLIAPPDRVLEIVAAEKLKFPSTVFTADAEERLRNDLTLQFYFDGLGYEVLYNSTPHGPEVLAVGFNEIQQLRAHSAGRDQSKLSTWLP